MLALCALAACSRRSERPGEPPRCALLITVEGLRADHVTFLGYGRQATRVRKESSELVLDIDRMAETGVFFANAYATSPEALPSLVSLHAGEAPSAPADGEWLAGRETLAEAFHAAGFATAAFVGGGGELLAAGLGRGFDASVESEDDREVLRAALEWLKDAPTDGQLFLWLHLGSLREPLGGESFEDYLSAPPGELVLDAELLADPEGGALARRRLVDRYDGAVEATNLLLHAFLENYRFGFLEDDLFEDSVVIVCGTNGFELAEREGRVGTGGALLDETLRVPLILRHPGSLTGRRILDEPVSPADLAPTLREWFDLGSPPAGARRSLLALTDSYEKKPFDARPALSTRSLGAGEEVERSWRDERWRVTLAAGRWSLFDIRRDRHALRDVAAEFPQELEAWRARVLEAGSAEDTP